MNRRIAWVVALVAIAIIAIAVVPLFRSGASRPSGPAGLSGPAPVFQLKDDRGGTVSLDRYRGKVVVMNLWASWCPPCRAEMPDLQRLEQAYGSQGVVVVGVNQGESADRARVFADSLKITFPIWIDDSQRYGRVYAALGLPTTVIIARDGNVVRGYDGALTLDQMRAAIAPLVHAS